MSSLFLFLSAFCAFFSFHLHTCLADCGVFDSNMGATFDFSDLIRSGDQPPYTVEDGDLPCTTAIEQNFTYYFNICGGVTGSLPQACQGKAGVQTASALQVNEEGTVETDDDYCYIAGKGSAADTVTSLLDHSDPTKGISLAYGGDMCSRGDQRRFNIELICQDSLNAIPTHALEFTHCSYTITMPSVYGCPLECPVSNRKLCAGNGHCAYDEDKASARCFCNNGFSGSDCSSTASSSSDKNYSPALLGLIITLFIIIVALIASLVFMIKQMSAYKDDLANYQVLKGGEDESSSAVV